MTVVNSLLTRYSPTVWKQAKIVPIFKSGDQKQAENYRDQFQSYQFYQNLSRKQYTLQLLKHLEENKLLSNSQYGYRAKRSTQLATALFVDSIREAAEKELLVFCS